MAGDDITIVSLQTQVSIGDDTYVIQTMWLFFVLS